MATALETPAALLARLEELYDAGRYADAAALGETMLELRGSRAVRGRIRLQLAMSYLQLGRTDLGSRLLPGARVEFEAIRDSEMIVECMAAEASAACLEQRPDALDLAKSALAACRALEVVPRTLEVRILGCIASTQRLFGNAREAIETFEAAIERADPVIDMRRLGKLLGDAGVAYEELGKLDKAISYSKRAMALFETLNDFVALAREENNLGCYLIRRGDTRSARPHLERALRLFDETDLKRSRGLLLLSLCELCMAEGDFHNAIAYADAALEAGESQDEAWSIADAHIWKGRIATKLGDAAGADEEFELALATLEHAGMPERLVACHAEYADILERRGDLPRACDHLRSALRISSGR
jgi:tetratricopeptide (TPR) repeat protein